MLPLLKELVESVDLPIAALPVPYKYLPPTPIQFQTFNVVSI